MRFEASVALQLARKVYKIPGVTLGSDGCQNFRFWGCLILLSVSIIQAAHSGSS
ncbi:hypothetical protein NIES39_L04350 [Arthrospira platensis NIES-39]|nr:hypothetical protein NIES39_L04350 [Arthrospira platensis NIES-39]